MWISYQNNWKQKLRNRYEIYIWYFNKYSRFYLFRCCITFEGQCKTLLRGFPQKSLIEH